MVDDLKLTSKNSITISERVGCGHVYLIFNLNKDGTFHKLYIRGTMAKSCDCSESFLDSFARILTFSLRRAIKEDTINEGIVNHLKGHRCSKVVIHGSTSCVDGIAKGIQKYLDYGKEENKKDTEPKDAGSK